MKRKWILLAALLVLTGARQRNLPPFEVTDTQKRPVIFAGDVTWRYGAAVIDVRDYGADPTGVADSADAFEDAIEALASISANIAPSAQVHVPKGLYRLSRTLRVARQVHIFGDGPTASVLRFPAMTTGIVVEYYNTGPGDTGNGSGAVLEGLGLEPVAGATAWQSAHVYAVGDRVVSTTNEHDGLIFRCTTAGTSSAIVEPTMPAYGSTVVDGSVTWTADYAAGVWMKGAGVIDSMRIGSVTVDIGFAGHGFQVIASTGDTPPTNANNWRAFGLASVKARGSCVYTHGADANRGILMSATVGECGSWGIHEDSFLGNTYETIVSQGNELGSYTTPGSSNLSTLRDCYSESDEPAADVRYPAMVIGGLFAGSGGGVDGFTTSSNAPRWVAGRFNGLVTSRSGNATDGYTVTTINPGNGDESHAIMFEAFNSSQATITGTDLRVKYVHSGYTAGTYRFDLYNSDLVVSGLIATENQASYPRGLWAFPSGIALGNSALNAMADCVIIADSAPPSTGTWKVCDVVVNTSSSSTILGWKCTVGGSPGTWTAIGVNGNGPTGPTGNDGATGATGPNWTTCQQASNSFAPAEQTGSCGDVVFSDSPTLTTPTLSGNTTAGTINSTTIPSSKTLVVTTDTIDVLASSTSAQFATLCSNETGTDKLVFSDNPLFTTVGGRVRVDAGAVGTGAVAITGLVNVAGVVSATTFSGTGGTSTHVFSVTGSQQAVAISNGGNQYGLRINACSGAGCASFETVGQAGNPNGGNGAIATAGASSVGSGIGGSNTFTGGAATTSGTGGNGLVATGGQTGTGTGGRGVSATGGAATGAGTAGNGVNGTGGAGSANAAVGTPGLGGNFVGGAGGPTGTNGAVGVRGTGGNTGGTGGDFIGGTNGKGITATGTGTGVAAIFTNSAGTGAQLQLVGNATAPPIRVECQANAPTGAAVAGDIYFDNTCVMYICTAAGTPCGTWTKIGGQ